MVPACQICPEEFMSNFTNETEYYSLQAVLSSQSSFTTLTHPAGHSMNTLYAIRQVPPCQNWPEEFLSNFTNETVYYSLQAVFSSGKSIYPSTRPAGHSMNSLSAIRWCPSAKIGPRNFLPILQMRLHITACRPFLVPESPITPSPHPAGHSMNTLYAIRQFPHARIGPRNFFPI